MACPEDRAILIVEDSDEDYEMLRWAFAEAGIANPLRRARGGEVAIKMMEDLADSEEGLPALVILDLNLIGMDGRAVLIHLKRNEKVRRVPVLIFSTSDNPRDVESCYLEGANAYALKPLDLDRFVAFARQIKAYWLEFIILPRRNGRDVSRGKSV